MRFLWRRRRVAARIAQPDERPEEAFAELLLDEGREELERADNKASILLGAFGLIAGVLLSGAIGGHWDPTEIDDVWARSLFWVGVGFGVLGMILLALAVMPKVKHDGDKEKLAYFGHVIQFSAGRRPWRSRARSRWDGKARERLREAICDASQGRFDRTVDQVWVISHIVQRKYKRVRRALILFGAGLVLCGAAIAADVIR